MKLTDAEAYELMIKDIENVGRPMVALESKQEEIIKEQQKTAKSIAKLKAVSRKENATSIWVVMGIMLALALALASLSLNYISYNKITQMQTAPELEKIDKK